MSGPRPAGVLRYPAPWIAYLANLVRPASRPDGPVVDKGLRRKAKRLLAQMPNVAKLRNWESMQLQPAE